MTVSYKTMKSNKTLLDIIGLEEKEEKAPEA